VRLKCRPEDFRVEERLRLRLKRRGRYSVYRLEKRGWNTLDVLRELERRHGWRDISRAGLKDRHALAVQYLSVRGGGPSSIVEKNYRLRLVGMADEPVSRDVLVANRFSIVLRALTGAEVEMVRRRLPVVARYGFPNYYDDQRFGSARHGQGFIARRLIEGHYNGALRLYLATPSAADDAQLRRSRQRLNELWGDWRSCVRHARVDERPIFEHLAARPGDFLGAVRLIPRDLLEVFVNAYQSYVWNTAMSGLLARLGIPTLRASYVLGTLLFYEEPGARHFHFLRRLTIAAPGPHARYRSERAGAAVEEALRSEGLRLAGLKLPFRMTGLFFKPFERAAIATPGLLRATPAQADDLYPGRAKLSLSFTLPPGSFATVVVKRLFAE